MTDFPKLGYRKEEVLDKHWKHDRVANKLRAMAPSSLDLGEIDLRPWSSPRHNQRSLGSCVAQATIKALEIKRNVKYGTDKHVDLSVLMLYYLARELMSPPETHLDEGTYISHAMDALRRFGVCEEQKWPYDINKYATAPPWKAMRRGYVNRIDSFYRITSHGMARVEDVLLHLHAKNPVVFGTAITTDFRDTTADDIVGPVNGVIKGGHAMVIVGYLPNHKGQPVFVVENSWGDFADGGFFYVSPEYVADPWAFDFWACASPWDDWIR
jgi:C1A family cysteine protease